MRSTPCRWCARCCAHSSAGCSLQPRTPPRMRATRLSSSKPTGERPFSSLTPALILVRLVFPFAAFHLIVLIDVADVEAASTAHRVGCLPVSGTVQYVIVGTAVERVGGSIPPEFVTSFGPAHRVGAGTTYSFVLPRATSHQVPPVPAVEPRVGSVSTVNLVNPAHRVDNVRSALPVDPVLARRAVHRIRSVRPPTLASVSSIAQAIEPITTTVLLIPSSLPCMGHRRTVALRN